eukprot:TRINITY_DN124886_c0_g1_i1.p1 TRINITY_DN124886_c0_g1~~TRINITY_DN124886_c0_g1_i1.p1  ORF type:complete len:371 (+),score=87.03 TRINITY_DN124886_c0_g1_i1:126-1238(+)
MCDPWQLLRLTNFAPRCCTAVCNAQPEGRCNNLLPCVKGLRTAGLQKTGIEDPARAAEAPQQEELMLLAQELSGGLSDGTEDESEVTDLPRPLPKALSSSLRSRVQAAERLAAAARLHHHGVASASEGGGRLRSRSLSPLKVQGLAVTMPPIAVGPGPNVVWQSCTASSASCGTGAAEIMEAEETDAVAEPSSGGAPLEVEQDVQGGGPQAAAGSSSSGGRAPRRSRSSRQRRSLGSLSRKLDIAVWRGLRRPKSRRRSGSTASSTAGGQQTARSQRPSIAPLDEEVDQAIFMSPADAAQAQMMPPTSISWDWPLSRLEKKARILMIDRQVLMLDRRELAQEVRELRRKSMGGPGADDECPHAEHPEPTP